MKSTKRVRSDVSVIGLVCIFLFAAMIGLLVIVLLTKPKQVSALMQGVQFTAPTTVFSAASTAPLNESLTIRCRLMGDAKDFESGHGLNAILLTPHTDDAERIARLPIEDCPQDKWSMSAYTDWHQT